MNVDALVRGLDQVVYLFTCLSRWSEMMMGLY